MCWSAKASLNTYLFALFGLAVGIFNGYDWRFLLFYITFSTVQLAEYGIWSHIDDKTMNAFYTQCLFLVLLLEPYASATVIEDPFKRNIAYVAYTVFLIAAAPLFLAHKQTWLSKKRANGHLDWQFTEKHALPLVMIWSLFLVVPFYVAGYYRSFAFGVASALISAYFYYTSHTWGTMWCWFAVAVWLGVIYEAINGSICY